MALCPVSSTAQIHVQQEGCCASVMVKLSLSRVQCFQVGLRPARHVEPDTHGPQDYLQPAELTSPRTLAFILIYKKLY
jgi:hypothetical protein